MELLFKPSCSRLCNEAAYITVLLQATSLWPLLELLGVGTTYVPTQCASPRVGRDSNLRYTLLSALRSLPGIDTSVHDCCSKCMTFETSINDVSQYARNWQEPEEYLCHNRGSHLFDYPAEQATILAGYAVKTDPPHEIRSFRYQVTQNTWP